MNLSEHRRARAQMVAAGAAPRREKARQEVGKAAKVYVDDVIDAWGWPFGISAKEVRQTLDEITADEIELHLNTPGGDCHEGVAIMNHLRDHPARITAYVDGWAASAGSVAMLGADEVLMSPGALVMIHDASTFAFGDADEMRTAAEFIDKVSGVMAGLYATKTGRPVEEIRALMSPKDTWLTDKEALDLGLVDGIDGSRSAADTEAAQARAVAAVTATAGSFTAASFDGSLILGGALTTNGTVTIGDLPMRITGDSTGAEAALARIAPQTPSAEPVASSTTQPTLEVAVAEDAANIPVEPGSESESPPTITAPAASAAGPDHLAEITRLSGEVASLRAEATAREKAEFFDTALAQGRVSPAERAELEGMYDQAPEPTKAFVLARAVGSVVPVAAIGHEGDGAPMTEYELLYGKGN